MLTSRALKALCHLDIPLWLRRSHQLASSQLCSLNGPASDQIIRSAPTDTAGSIDKPKPKPTDAAFEYSICLVEGPSRARDSLVLAEMPQNPRAWRLLDNLLLAFDWHRATWRVVILAATANAQQRVTMPSLYPHLPTRCLLFGSPTQLQGLDTFWGAETVSVVLPSLDTLLLDGRSKKKAYATLIQAV